MLRLPPSDILLRPVLLPILLVQAIGVRRRALSLPEATGAREGVTTGTHPLRLLMVGDSSAAGVGVTHQDQALLGQTLHHLGTDFQVAWRLIANTGATELSTLDTLTQDRDTRSEQYDIAVLVLGVNDAVRLRSARKWVSRHRQLREVLVTRYGVKHIIIPGIPPLHALPALTRLMRWLLGAHARRLDDALSETLSQESHSHHIPFDVPLSADALAEDGYHPNAQSYALFGARIAAQVRALWLAEFGDS